MQVECAVELPAPATVVLEELADLSGRDLAAIATAATSSGEALLERSGLAQLDQASQCHFGAQLGRPIDSGSVARFQLRWWNDRSTSLTPGFIGELRVAAVTPQRTEVAIIGEYHPRARLYELVQRGFVHRMANAVAAEFVEQLRSCLLAGLTAGLRA